MPETTAADRWDATVRELMEIVEASRGLDRGARGRTPTRARGDARGPRCRAGAAEEPLREDRS